MYSIASFGNTAMVAITDNIQNKAWKSLISWIRYEKYDFQYVLTFKIENVGFWWDYKYEL